MWRKYIVGLMATAALLPLAAQALTVSPIVVEYDVKPGQAAVGSVKLTNESNATETFYPTVEDFIAGDQAGTPKFIGVSANHSLTGWVSFQKASYTLNAGDTVYAVYNINVPTTAIPGGYSGGLLFSSSNPSVTQGVGIASATGPLLFIRVAGTVNESGVISSFNASPTSASSLPVNFNVAFQNTGDVYVAPAGTIRITNMFGTQVGSVPVNANGNIVLSSSTRSFSSAWQKSSVAPNASEFVKEWNNFGFGPYTATLVLNYGEANQVASASTSFMVIPWMLIILAIVLIIVLALLVNEYNKWIIAKAMMMKSKK